MTFYNNFLRTIDQHVISFHFMTFCTWDIVYMERFILTTKLSSKLCVQASMDGSSYYRIREFAECQKHLAKPRIHSTKPLSSVAQGKDIFTECLFCRPFSKLSMYCVGVHALIYDLPASLKLKPLKVCKTQVAATRC